MTARVEDSDVKAILDTEVQDLAPYIQWAHLIVERNLLGCGYTEDELKELERWLAAHAVALAPPSGWSVQGASQMKEAQLSLTLGGQYGMRLESTRYGQQALMLDQCGVLATLGKRRAKLTML